MISLSQKKILVAVDQSDMDKSVVKSALDVARNTDSSIIILSVIDIAKFIASVGELNYNSIMGEEKGLEKYLQNLVKNTAKNDTKIEFRIMQGDPASKICEFAKELGASLVVIGTRGLGKIKSKLLGSVSENVIKNCNCSVLIVRS